MKQALYLQATMAGLGSKVCFESFCLIIGIKINIRCGKQLSDPKKNQNIQLVEQARSEEAWLVCINLRRLHRSKKNYQNIIVIGQIIGSGQIDSGGHIK